jgi:hypothetical protein
VKENVSKNRGITTEILSMNRQVSSSSKNDSNKVEAPATQQIFAANVKLIK